MPSSHTEAPAWLEGAAGSLGGEAVFPKPEPTRLPPRCGRCGRRLWHGVVGVGSLRAQQRWVVFRKSISGISVCHLEPWPTCLPQPTLELCECETHWEGGEGTSEALGTSPAQACTLCPPGPGAPGHGCRLIALGPWHKGQAVPRAAVPAREVAEGWGKAVKSTRLCSEESRTARVRPGRFSWSRAGSERSL